MIIETQAIYKEVYCSDHIHFRNPAINLKKKLLQIILFSGFNIYLIKLKLTILDHKKYTIIFKRFMVLFRFQVFTPQPISIQFFSFSHCDGL